MARYIVFEGDNFLSAQSLQLRGDYDTKQEAIQGILDNHEFYYGDFFDDGCEVGADEQFRLLQAEVKKWLDIENQVYAGGLGYKISVVDENEWV